MSDSRSEQNKTEDATPFKLQKARERGQVARSMEPGFLAGLVALLGFLMIAGQDIAASLSTNFARAVTSGIDAAAEPAQSAAIVAGHADAFLAPVLLLGGIIIGVVILLEILQLRGLFFTGHPLKPDFNRMNPVAGLKRLFSARLLKETLKTIAKVIVYALATWLVITWAIDRYALMATESVLPTILFEVTLRLLLTYAGIALAFVALDQVLVRQEFAKQMRMSRREVTREAREREGEPRIKQRRRQLHAEFAQQSRGTLDLAGSDMLVVNPEHYAVALLYDQGSMEAPVIRARGRNRHALALKERATQLGIPIFERPAIARRLFRNGRVGDAISAESYADVAALYQHLFRLRAARETE